MEQVDRAIQSGISYTLRLYKPEIGLIGSHPKKIGSQIVPSNEYAIRHINCLAWKVLKPFCLKLSEQIKGKVEGLGFLKDLYDPLFGLTYDTPYDPTLYRDCYLAIRKHLPVGSTYYPYRSAVFYVTPFIWAKAITRFDPLCWSLEVLNNYWKNGKADKHKLEKCSFDGHGIKGGLMHFLSEYSTLRLAVYMATNVAIGQFDIADKSANILLQLQCKDNPVHEGGFYRAYKSSFNSYEYSIPSRHNRIGKFLSQTPELPASQMLTDAERTLVSIASLILYKSNKWGHEESW